MVMQVRFFDNTASVVVGREPSREGPAESGSQGTDNREVERRCDDGISLPVRCAASASDTTERPTEQT